MISCQSLFSIQESEELRDVQDEFENNRSTKISQKEVDELMQELFEAYELDQEVNKQAKKHKRKDYPVKTQYLLKLFTHNQLRCF